MKKILEERGLWRPNLSVLIAKSTIQKLQHRQKRIDDSVLRKRAISCDFLSQVSLRDGLNRVCTTKRYSRKYCTCTLAGLREVLPGALESVPDTLVREDWNRTQRIIKMCFLLSSPFGKLYMLAAS